jgi:methionyl-tRNA formyltransferase
VTSLRLVFAGSPAAAVPSLEALIASQHDVAAVITREDSPQGRRGILTATPVAEAAGAIPVIKANRLNDSVTEKVRDLEPDLGVIVAYGGLVKEPLLSTPRLGWINLHFSLLPRWRGAAPVQHSVIAGDELTGATVFQLVAELDAGDVFGQLTEPIGHHQTAGGLLQSLSQSGAELLVRVVDAIADGSARAEPQVGDVTLAPKLHLADGLLDWSKDAVSVSNHLRGVTPEPGAFTMLDGSRFKVLDATIGRELPRLAPGQFQFVDKKVLVGTSTDPIQLHTVQPAGKKAMNAADWWRGLSSTNAVVAE